MNMKGTLIIVGILVVLVAVLWGVMKKGLPDTSTGIPEGVACTMDAMQCPDGTYVGRSGPNCEFVCPGN